MKRVIGALLCNVFSLCVIAQSSFSAIDPEHIEISDSLTTTLIFPYAIIKASWCSPFVAVQQTREVGNVLEIKATAKDFSPSNLSVVTRDGQFYSFLLHYEKYAYPFTWRFEKDTALLTAVQLNEFPINEKLLGDNAKCVRHANSFMRKKKNNAQLRVDVRGLFLSERVHWLSLDVKNKNAAPITIASVVINRSHKKIQNTIAQPQPLPIIYQSLPQIITGHANTRLAIAIPQQPIRRQQLLTITLLDDSGVPLITQTVSTKLLRKAKYLPNE